MTGLRDLYGNEYAAAKERGITAEGLIAQAQQGPSNSQGPRRRWLVKLSAVRNLFGQGVAAELEPLVEQIADPLHDALSEALRACAILTDERDAARHLLKIHHERVGELEEIIRLAMSDEVDRRARRKRKTDPPRWFAEGARLVADPF